MRFLSLLLVFALSLTLPAQAQDDRGFLQSLLENTLSDAGRDVRIEGFEGALSARATLESLTIADNTGVWLTARDVVLDWNRAALLQGRLEVNTFTAKELLLPRAPIPTPQTTDTGAAGVALPALPAPQATPFALPQLPVSVDIGQLSIARAEIGAPILGAKAVVQLSGSADLTDGAGKAALSVTRIDGPRGHFALSGSFDNVTRQLMLDLSLSEAADGLVSNLIGLPDTPSLNLSIKGDGPLTAFNAAVMLGTDGAPRFAGTVALTGTDDAAGLSFAADLGGDLRPMFAQDYRDFFGPRAELVVRGTQPAAGGLVLDALDLTTRALSLSGSLALAPDGWPTQFALDGTLAAPDGGPVLLAIPGARTLVGGGTLILAFDAADGDAWSAEADLTGVQQGEFALGALSLVGRGNILRGAEQPIGNATGVFDLSASGVAATDPALARALGETLSGRLRFDHTQGQPLTIPHIALTAGDATLSGHITIADLGQRIDGSATVTATRLNRFADLIGEPLAGAANLSLTGWAEPLNGIFDVDITGRSRDLSIGQAYADILMAGDGDVAISVQRDEAGLHIDRADITTAQARLSGTANLMVQGSEVKITADLPDAAVLAAGLNGPAKVQILADQTDTGWDAVVDTNGPGAAVARANGAFTIRDNVVQAFTGTARLTAETLAPYASLAGQDIGGGIDLDLNGHANLIDGSGTGQMQLAAQDLRTGTPEADKLLSGASTLDADLSRDKDGMITIKTAHLKTPELTSTAKGQTDGFTGQISFDAALRDLSLFVAELSGPLTASGTAAAQTDGWAIDTTATGPGGTKMALSGRVASDAQHANLKANGTTPLALANLFMSPNIASGQAQYDLALNGPLTLSSLSGTLTTSGARLSVPEAKLAFDQIAARINLARGQARIDATAAPSSGGQISVAGPIAVTAPYAGDLAVRVIKVGLIQPGLFETKLNGGVTVQGPLEGGARVAGTLELGQVELRVPDGLSTGGAGLPGLQHRAEPAAVRATRRKAGVISSQSGAAPGTSKAYPLDITINAPSRIFVRGRGLDAELGGSVTIQGNSTAIAPQGRFDLIRGRLDILGKRLSLSEASIQMDGSLDPYLHVLAETTSDDTTIQFAIDGPTNAPEVSITSSPDLPEDEILARLLFGRDITEISAVQALQLAAAINTLAGGGSGMGDRLRQKIGLDDLDISSDADGNTGVSAGKYISDNVYSSVTATSDGKTEINLNLQVSPSVTARGSAGSDGNSSLGIHFEKDY